MHYLHTLTWLLDRLAALDPIAWAVVLGLVVVIAICVWRDLRRKGRMR
jgi:hypothetical protein